MIQIFFSLSLVTPIAKICDNCKKIKIKKMKAQTTDFTPTTTTFFLYSGAADLIEIVF